VKFAFITKNVGRFPKRWMCRRLSVSPSGYYAWRKRQASLHKTTDRRLRTKIRAAYTASRGTYGSPRIQQELRADGLRVSPKRIARLMREEGLQGRRRGRFRATTDSRHERPVATNLVARAFTEEAPNRCWVGDITYVRTWEGWLYLAVLVDLYSRRVVGYAMAEHMRKELPLEALKAAGASHGPQSGWAHHSDRGPQYASEDYPEALKDAGARCGMRRKGDGWDNAVAESFFATLKEELIDRGAWPTRASAKAAITQSR